MQLQPPKEEQTVSIYKKSASFDIVVVGGGLSGMCAAIAAARMGANTAIVQNRSVFGGNASSEIRMHILGANCHQSKDNLRETGIIEEILLANKSRNPYASFPVFDTVMWEKVRFQKNLTSFLNTNMDDVLMEDGKIKGILCHQSSTETEWTLYGNVFVDATGHGTLGVMAGGAHRMGSESKYEFNEPSAPEEANTDTMGNSMMFIAADRKEPVKFKKPEWAYTFTEEQLKHRPHLEEVTAHADDGEIVAPDAAKNQLPGFSNPDSGYWWIELGGDSDDIIAQHEEIRDDLVKSVFGVWDHIKNGGNHGNIENYDLDWVGMVPGYRESRRLEGDYILTENDVRANRIFEDAVAYGAWPMDVHVRGGLKDWDKYPSMVLNFEGCYTIPYGCYCSKNIDNLMMAGRDISASKMAFSSLRVMGTCAIGGQAVGTAAAMAVQKGCSPKEIGKQHIRALQQQLLKDDCYIPGFKNEDENDLARSARVTATSETEGCPAANVTNGVARTVGDASNCWASAPLSEGPQTLTLQLQNAAALRQVRLTFDSDLSRENMPSIVKIVRERQEKTLPAVLVKDYRLALLKNGETVWEETVEDNTRRLCVHDLPAVDCDTMQLTVTDTYGHNCARVFEVRIYKKEN
ncbi:MAG: FAD-dependent oxidoreductase [Clostridia bacterium]|nr:FAD-dependent oxidoreductase [Clostridia bacterium]